MGPQTDVRPDHPGGVDLYVGGVEHAVLHLLYARFWHKVLFDLGHVSSYEPYPRLFNQGYILAAAYTGRARHLRRGRRRRGRRATARSPTTAEPVTREWGKMGKSLKNARVARRRSTSAYGADTLRLYEMAMGPLDASRPWETRDVVGMYRFLQRLWRNVVDEEHRRGVACVDDAGRRRRRTRLLHRTIDGVRTEMEALRFNTAIAKLIELNNHLTKLGGDAPRGRRAAGADGGAAGPARRRGAVGARSATTAAIAYVPFPDADPALLVDDTVEYPVQVNGKVRGHITVAADADDDDGRGRRARRRRRSSPRSAGATPKKVIVVPGRMVNIVV